MEIITIYPRGFGANTYAVTSDGQTAIVIDPSQPRVESELIKRGLKATYVLLTHCHFDHVGGVGGVVLGDPCFDAADAILRRGGRGDDGLERRKVGGEGPCKVVGAGGGRAVFDGIGCGEGDCGIGRAQLGHQIWLAG